MPSVSTASVASGAIRAWISVAQRPSPTRAPRSSGVLALIQVERVEDAVALRRRGRDRLELARQVVLEEPFREEHDGLAPLDVAELRDDVGQPLQELPRLAVALVDDDPRVLDEQPPRDRRILCAGGARPRGRRDVARRRRPSRPGRHPLEQSRSISFSSPWTMRWAS